MNRMVYQKKKKRKTFHPFRTLLMLLIIAAISIVIYQYKTYGNMDAIIQTFSNINFSKIVASDKSYSSQNSIDGQTSVEGKDGYTTTFTTLSTNNPKTYKEYKQNQNASWSENEYWGGTMRENGCGITSMAIVASGYGLDITPEDLRQKYYPHLDSSQMSNAMKDLGFQCTDFYFHGSYLSKSYIQDWLKSNRPIIICVDSKKENMWTRIISLYGFASSK